MIYKVKELNKILEIICELLGWYEDIVQTAGQDKNNNVYIFKIYNICVYIFLKYKIYVYIYIHICITYIFIYICIMKVNEHGELKGKAQKSKCKHQKEEKNWDK
jgi:hypothetical protein